MWGVPRQARESSLGTVIAALVVAVCCAGPVVIGILAATGVGVVLATFGLLATLAALVTVAVIAWLRRRSHADRAHEMRAK
jgi:threonine/homoserine/homoserine lactone efflux protein